MPISGDVPQRASATASTPVDGTLGLSESSHPPATVLAVVGEVDVRTVGSLRTRLTDLLVEGSPRLVVDLSGVTFMDSSGLGALVSAQKRARVFRGTLVLVVVNDAILRVLRLTALDRVFTVHATLEEALASARVRPRGPVAPERVAEPEPRG